MSTARRTEYDAGLNGTNYYQSYISRMNFNGHQSVKRGMIVIIILCLLSGCDSTKSRIENRIVEENELIELKATLANQPSVKTSSKGGPWVPLKLNEFPGLLFEVRGVKYNALSAAKFVKEVSAGDSIFLSVLLYDYETRITREKSLPLSEKIMNNSLIEPYSIQSKGKIYMTLEGVNREWRLSKDTGKWLFSWVVGVIALAGLVYLILRQSGIKNKAINWWNKIQSNP